MNKGNQRIASFALLLAVFALSVPVSAAATVSITNAEIAPGESVTMLIMIKDVTDLGVADINLTYDQSVINVLGVANSDFDTLVPNIDNVAGITRIGDFHVGNPGLSGNVTLAEVTLKAVGDIGECSTLNSGVNELKTISGVDIPVTVVDGTFCIVDTTPTTYNITLLPGWNLISIPLEQDNWSITSVMASVEGNYTVVYTYINGVWKKSTAARNPLTDMSLKYAYWVYMSAPGTLELSGAAPSATTLNLVTGWNFAGYPSLTTQNITTVLAQVNYSVVYAYVNGAWKKSTAARNPLTELMPGYGNWIYANEAGSYEVD